MRYFILALFGVSAFLFHISEELSPDCILLTEEELLTTRKDSTNYISSYEAASRIGDYVEFEGEVVDLAYREDKPGSPMFVNVDEVYPNNPIVVVYFEDVANVFDGVISEGNSYVFRGEVTEYYSEYQQQWLPSLVLREQGQVE